MATLPIQYLPFTTNVIPDHLQCWHKLATIYHSDPTRFTNISRSIIKSYEDSPQSDPSLAPSDSSGPNTSVSQKQNDETLDLYKHILESCSCGECYNIFERPDRIPWRLDADNPTHDASKPGIIYYNNYVNAKHGKISINTQCLCAIKSHEFEKWKGGKPSVRGYIYNNYLTLAQSSENKHKVEQLGKRSDIMNAAVEKAQLDNSNIKHRAMLDQAKTSAEVTKQNIDSTSKLQDKIEKLEKQLANAESIVDKYGFDSLDQFIDTPLANKIARAESITARDIQAYQKAAERYDEYSGGFQNIKMPYREKTCISYFNSLGKVARIKNNLDREISKLEQLNRKISDNVSAETTSTGLSPEVKRLKNASSGYSRQGSYRSLQ